MSTWLLTFGMLAALGGQLEGTSATDQDEAISRAVQELGSAQFSTRRRATRFLWEQGLDAQPILERATESVDREVRMRAGYILADFRYGILPGVPAEVVDRIRLFRDGDVNQRQVAMFWLADQSHFDTVQRLIQLEPDPDSRRQYLVNLMQNEQAVQYFLDRDRLEALIAAIGADQDAAWRRSMLAQALFTENMIQRLLDRGQLGTLVKIVDQEPSADVRRQMLSTLFGNQAAVAVLIDKGQLDFVLDLIGKEPEQRIRSQWISGVLMNSEAIKTLAADERLERVLAFAQKHMDDDERRQAVTRMFQSSTVLKAILDQRGIDRLVAMVMTEKDPEARGQLMSAMVSSSSVRAALEQDGQLDLVMKLAREEKDPVARGHYLKAVMTSSVTYYLLRDAKRRKELWEFVKADLDKPQEADTDWRGEAVYRILTSYPSAEDILKEEADAKWLFQYLSDYASKGDRSRILERLVVDYRLKSPLLKHIGLEPVLELVKQVGVPQRGRIMGRLFASSSSSDPVLKEDKAELLITLAREEEDPESRRQYLEGLFQNGTTMKMLVDGGFYDKLWQLIESEADADRHASLRGYFVRDNSVLETLQKREQLDSAVTFPQELEDAAARRTYLRLVYGGSQAMSVLISKGYFDTLLVMAKDDPDEASRQMLLGEFYVNQTVIERLAELKQASVLLEFAKEYTDRNRGLNFLQRIFYNEKAVTALVEEGQIEAMFELARSQENKYSRSSLLRAIFNGPAVAQHYAKEKKLKDLFAMLKEEEDDNTRQQVFSNLVNRADTAALIVEAGGLDDMIGVIQEYIQADQQGALLGRLVTHDPVVEHLKSQDQLDRVLKLVSEQPTINSRRAFLQALFGSTSALAALIGQDHFETLYELASSDGDPRRRTQYRAQLLSNSATVQHLVETKNIGLLLKVASEQSDDTMQRTIVAQILASQAAVEALAEHGQFGQLVDLCLAISDEKAKRRMCAELLLSPLAVKYLAESGSLEQLVKDVLAEPEEDVLKSFLERWVSKFDAIAALLDHGYFDAVYKVALEKLNDDRKNYFLQRLTYDATASRLLTRPEIGQALFAWLDGQSDAQRQSYLQQIMQNAQVWQALIRSGQTDLLAKIAALEADAESRQKYWRRILDAPGGLVTHHIVEGEFDQAQQLLEDNSQDDLGRLRLTTFLLVSGKLEERIATERKRLADTPDQGDLRLLVYLLRAQGDLEGARSTAAATEDAGLLKAVLVEQRRWAEAADLLAAGPCPLPVPLTASSTATQTHEEVERLSYLAAYQRLAGRDAECDAALEEIRQRAADAVEDQNLQWYAVEAHLLNDRYPEGMRLIAESYPDRAYTLLSHQMQYEQALALAGWQEGIEVDRNWFDAIPVKDATGDELAMARIDMALRAAGTLHMLGRRQQAAAIVEVVKAFVMELPDNGSSSSSPRKQGLERLCRSLLYMDRAQAAWELAAKTLLSSTSPPYALSRIYPRSYSEARGWWTVLSKRHPGDPPEALFGRVHALLNLTPEENADEFAALAEEAAKLMPSLSGTYRNYVMTAIASACAIREKPELTIRCFELAGDAAVGSKLELADALRDAGQWDQATKVYQQVWDEDRQQIAALYLAGVCLGEAGQAEEAARLQQLAGQLAIESRARLDLAKALLDRDLDDLALPQLRLVLQTAPFEHWEWNDAARLIGGRIVDQDPAEAATMLEYSQLDDLRITFYLLDHKDYLNVRSIIYRWRARAAIAADDLDQADRCLDRAMTASPGSTDIGEEVVPLLAEAGHAERADALFQRLYQPYRDKIAAYPESAYLKNNGAWLAARCGRELDAALKLAQDAVALAPTNGSYLDTLAEVYFQQGDRPSAIKYSQQACQLSPDSQTLKDQLRRFEHDPLPKTP